MDDKVIAEIFRDEHRMEKLVDAITRIEEAVTSLAEKVGVAVSKVEEGTTRAKAGIEDVDDALKGTAVSLQLLDEKAEQALGRLDKIGQHLKGIFADLQEPLEKLGSRLSNIQSNAEATLMTFVRGIPYVGGILEMMIESQFRGDRFATAGRNAYLNFQRSDTLDATTTRIKGAEVGADMMRLEENFLGTREEVNAVWAAYAAGGRKASEMFQEADLEVKGFGNTVSQVSLGLDKTFGLQAGSTATFSNQLRSAGGALIDREEKAISRIGQAARATGQDMQAFMGTILQVTSALRVQGGNAEDLTKTYLRLASTVKGLQPGASDQRIAAITNDALGGLTTFTQGMPEGLRALVGKDMRNYLISQGMGKYTKGFEGDLGALRGMATGFNGAFKDEDFQRLATQFGYARFKQESHTSNKNELFRGLMQMGMPAGLAHLLVESEGKFGSDDKMKEAFAKELEKAKDLQPLKTEDYKRAMDQLQNAINAIGQAMIGLLGTLVSLVGGGIELFARVTSDPTNAGKYAGAYLSNVDRNISNVGANLAKAATLGAGALGDLGTSFNSMLGRDEHTASGSFFMTKEMMAEKEEKDLVKSLLQRKRARRGGESYQQWSERVNWRSDLRDALASGQAQSRPEGTTSVEGDMRQVLNIEGTQYVVDVAPNAFTVKAILDRRVEPGFRP